MESIPPACRGINVDRAVLHRRGAKLLRGGHRNRRGWQEIQPLRLLHSTSSERQFVQPFWYWSEVKDEPDINHPYLRRPYSNILVNLEFRRPLR